MAGTLCPLKPQNQACVNTLAAHVWLGAAGSPRRHLEGSGAGSATTGSDWGSQGFTKAESFKRFSLFWAIPSSPSGHTYSHSLIQDWQRKRTHIHVVSGTWATYAHYEGISMFSCPPAQSCTPECSRAFRLMIIPNGAQNPTFPTEVFDIEDKWENAPSQPALTVIPGISKRNSWISYKLTSEWHKQHCND